MPFDAYILCTSPRSGSTMLCKMLADTGVAGDPGSFFHRPTVQGWADALGLSGDGDPDQLMRDIFRAVVPKGRGDTDLFAMRLQAHSLSRFRDALATCWPDAPTDRDRIQAAFGRTAFIYLRRANKLDQAVSYLRAQHSGLWHVAPDGSEIERTAPHRTPVYDARAIAAQIAEFDAYDVVWEAWFDAAGIVPLRLDYDALSAAPGATLTRVLDALHLAPARAASVRPRTKKLADDVSTEWIRRFQAERG